MINNSIVTWILVFSVNGVLFGQLSMAERTKMELARAVNVVDQYQLGEYSKRKESTPQGIVTKYSWISSKVYPGTTRDYWIYVPKQYDPTKPACLVIFQDGEAYLKGGTSWSRGISPTIVFDNLIQEEAIPVTIALFVNPGDKGPGIPELGGTDNRSFEYDAVTSQYSDFLIEEIIPEVQKNYNITSNPKGRILVGVSSGAICSFNAAWHRPDHFGNVVSHCGSFVNIRGGNKYPELIRRSQKKPIRVYLQDGTNDLDLVWGNWFLSNQSMAKSLEFAGYDYQFIIGEGGHNLNHAGELFPETLKWIWRDFQE